MAGNKKQIGDVCKLTGASADAIRMYEKLRLLDQPVRSEGGFRLFAEQDIEQIQFIRRAQSVGFSLAEIRELRVAQAQDGEVCSHVREMVRAKIAAVRAKIRELTALEDQLEKDLQKCRRRLKANGDAHGKSCPVLEEFRHGAAREN
jgi:DNA-binding transcriptional MerR regulator